MRQINGSVRLGCQRCLGWDVLAHYYVCCLWMEGALHPSICPSVHLSLRPPIHPSIHLPIAECCFSVIRRETETDRYTYTSRDTPTQHKANRHTHRETVIKRHRERQRWKQTLMEKEIQRETDKDEGKTDMPRDGGHGHKHAGLGHNSALGRSRLGPGL